MITAILLGMNIQAQSLTITVYGIRNTTGRLQIAIFENAQQFKDEIPVKKLFIDKSEITDSNTSIQTDLAPGTFGIAVLNDEDESGAMTYRFKVYPLEGVGFSNFTMKGLKKPDFSDFDFTIITSGLLVNVEMKYF